MLLVRNADVPATMDDARREIRGGGVLVEGDRLLAVGLGAHDAELFGWHSALCPIRARLTPLMRH